MCFHVKIHRELTSYPFSGGAVSVSSPEEGLLCTCCAPGAYLLCRCKAWTQGQMPR